MGQIGHSFMALGTVTKKLSSKMKGPWKLSLYAASPAPRIVAQANNDQPNPGAFLRIGSAASVVNDFRWPAD
jgi:hypothetical protein